MPVTLEILASPSPSEQVELERLVEEQEACPTFKNAWRRWLAGEGDLRLWAARFNDRIVGAALTREDCIEGFAVRRITQGRGVGTRMVQCLKAQGNWRLSPQLEKPVRDFIHLWHGVPF